MADLHIRVGDRLSLLLLSGPFSRIGRSGVGSPFPFFSATSDSRKIGCAEDNSNVNMRGKISARKY